MRSDFARDESVSGRERPWGPGRRWRLPPGLWSIDQDFWFDRRTWSAYIGFLVLVAISLLLGLPSSEPVRQLTAGQAWPVGVFPMAFVIVYGVLALTLGQCEVAWEARLSPAGQLGHLGGRLLFALALVIPLWLSYLFAYSREVILIGGLFVHLALYGIVFGLLGWWLGLTRRSEITQFNLKYLLFFSYVVATTLIQGLRYLNPVAPIDAMLWGHQGSVGFSVTSELLWVAVGTIAGWRVRRRLIVQRQG